MTFPRVFRFARPESPGVSFRSNRQIPPWTTPLQPTSALKLSIAFALFLPLAGPIRAQNAALTLDSRPIPGGVLTLLPPKESFELGCTPPTDGLAEPGPLHEAGAALVQEVATRYEWAASSGRLQGMAPGSVRWYPPVGGGLGRVSVTVADDDRTASAQADFLAGTLFDREGDGTLGGTIIGIYPNEHAESAPGVVGRNASSYEPPGVFYRIDADTSDRGIVGYWSLGRLNPPVFTDEEVRYVAMDERIPAFAEAVESAVADALQVAPGSLRVLRGFVSPNERARLERMGIQLAEFTRFQYGDCLALIVDENRDYRMDDLNKDGKSDAGDAEMLAGVVEDAMRENALRGGVGICSSFEGPNHIGTPYVQADLRGWTVTWRE